VKGDFMDENLKYIIEFAKELRKNSSEVTEDESSLEFLINDIEGVRVEEFIDKLVAEGGIFSFKIQNKKILIIDDVYTTGQTLFHAADCLQVAQPKIIRTISLAR